MYKYFKKIGNTRNISSWESKGLSDEVIKPPSTSDNSLAPTPKYAGKRMYVKFNGSCLKHVQITFRALDLMEKKLFHMLVVVLVTMQ